MLTGIEIETTGIITILEETTKVIEIVLTEITAMNPTIIDIPDEENKHIPDATIDTQIITILKPKNIICPNLSKQSPNINPFKFKR